ncbi:hypothetical protein BGZ60DRAFT_471425 [Tricladium varicosporioides]|nr:hypothetical protein BGZ60DRAFT_471425 [Hymenoscyphus varicosporioides]
MKSIYSLAAATSVLLATIVSAGDGNIGCYSSVPGFNFSATIQYNTDGSCRTSCKPGLYGVMATTKGSDCWCGNVVPMPSLKTDNSSCSTPCTGFGDFTCGGPDAWTVYLTGFSNSVSTAADSSTASTPSSTKSAAPSVVTQPGSTIVVTAGSSVESSSSASAKSSGSPSKAGIAAGVVVGIVAIAAIAGGIFLFVRNKKRREVEEEYRRNAAVNSFINGGGKPPNSSGGASSFTDTRLDANVMAQRRMSDGSIADNQDYSRRILKVCRALLRGRNEIC